MATRSAIGLMNKRGKVVATYCHWDGYPDGVGKDLVTGYKNVRKVQELLKRGKFGISSLDVNIKDTKFYEDDGDGPIIKSFSNLDDLIDNPPGNVEYIYVFDVNTNKWAGYKRGNDEPINLGESFKRSDLIKLAKRVIREEKLKTKI